MTFDPLKLNVETVGPKNGSRRVVFSSGDTQFGAFDGYKKSKTGSLKLATPDWMEGAESKTVLRATMEIAIEAGDRSSPGIEPFAENPTGWGNHSVSGRVDRIVDDISELLEGVSLLDGPGEGKAESEIDPSPFTDSSAAVIATGDGDVLMDLSEIDQNIDLDSNITIRSSRLDIMGYLDP